jgi:hypothetical protein
MENAVEKLTKKIAWHESEAQRLRAALDVFRELDSDGESGGTPTSLAELSFMEALQVVLKGGAKKTTAEVRRALQAGGFESKSANFSAMVQNRLADAAKRRQIVKNGEGRGLTWSLPASGFRRLV